MMMKLGGAFGAEQSRVKAWRRRSLSEGILHGNEETLRKTRASLRVEVRPEPGNRKAADVHFLLPQEGPGKRSGASHMASQTGSALKIQQTSIEK